MKVINKEEIDVVVALKYQYQEGKLLKFSQFY